MEVEMKDKLNLGTLKRQKMLDGYAGYETEF